MNLKLVEEKAVRNLAVFVVFVTVLSTDQFPNLILVGDTRSPVATVDHSQKRKINKLNNNKSNPVFEAFFTLNKTKQRSNIVQL